MSWVAVITDHKYRPLVCWLDLPEHWRTWFDYMTDELEQTTPRFVKYKKWWYDVGDCMRASDPLRIIGFDAYHGDSYFSGIAFKWPAPGDDGDPDRVICASILS